jgi:eukaryotic-like serine/threonine-protein kinase
MNVGESPPLGRDPLIAQLVADRYRVIRKLGEGGMGSVYLAEHVVIEKRIVLKVLAPELARRQDLVARFLQEARSASRIGHENVIDISDFGQSAEGLVYIAMEYLEGKDLGQVVRAEGALAWERVRDIVVQICRALREAHDKGIVHRDMKPENIFLIHREGRPEFVKILDFGIAKIMGLDPNGPRLTRTGMIFGTPEYMAPEQAEGKEADHRVDIYAVGCIIYHLMTGQTPFAAENFMAMLTKHMMEDPVPPSVRRPDLAITPEMDALVGKALEKDRDKRYQSMAEFLEAVSTCRGPDKASGQLAAAGYTREMGGAHAKAALKATGTVDRTSDAELVPRGWAEAAASEIGGRPVRSRPNQKLVLAVVGVVLGAAGGVGLALHLRNPPVPAPTAAGEAKVIPAPTPAPVPTPAAPTAPQVAAPTAPSPVAPAAPSPPPPIAETPPVAPEVTAPAKHGHRSAHRRPGHANSSIPAAKPGAGIAHPAVSTPAAPVKPPLPLAPGLKPFPGQ